MAADVLESLQSIVNTVISVARDRRLTEAAACRMDRRFVVLSMMMARLLKTGISACCAYLDTLSCTTPSSSESASSSASASASHDVLVAYVELSALLIPIQTLYLGEHHPDLASSHSDFAEGIASALKHLTRPTLVDLFKRLNIITRGTSDDYGEITAGEVRGQRLKNILQWFREQQRVHAQESSRIRSLYRSVLLTRGSRFFSRVANLPPDEVSGE